jgi:hypothetical protein
VISFESTARPWRGPLGLTATGSRPTFAEQAVIDMASEAAAVSGPVT